ncbi:MAG TPA: ClpX C4-type zinc finger protein [Solirubrobacteraceae bacterium]|nr:ClpX C4-type zinc finger protein [Solirubrobacteraceae bacterium]
MWQDRHQVERLIAGPGVYICNRCIELRAEILAEERAGEDPSTIPPDST